MINAINDSKPQNSDPEPKINTETLDMATPLQKSPVNIEVSKLKEEINKIKTDDNKKPTRRKNKFNVKMIAGILFLLLLIIGGGAGFFLSQQSQDLRQQAAPLYSLTAVDQGCIDDFDCPSGLRCINGYCKGSGTSGPTLTPGEQTCVDSGGTVTSGGLCTFGGTADCSGILSGGGDPCASNGGICQGTGVLRCRCGNAWIGVVGDSCDGMCGVANLVCDGSSCDDDIPDPPNEPTPPPTPTPPPALVCNDSCSSNTQCSSVNSGWVCDATSSRCRLAANLESTTCEPAVIPNEPICKDVAILDVNDNELNPATDPFSIGMVLKFRCAADDPDSQVTNFEFRVTEPDGTIVDGSAINPAGSSATSLEYQIDQYLTHIVQCRACLSTECQEWVTLTE